MASHLPVIYMKHWVLEQVQVWASPNDSAFLHPESYYGAYKCFLQANENEIWWGFGDEPWNPSETTFSRKTSTACHSWISQCRNIGTRWQNRAALVELCRKHCGPLRRERESHILNMNHYTYTRKDQTPRNIILFESTLSDRRSNYRGSKSMWPTYKRCHNASRKNIAMERCFCCLYTTEKMLNRSLK